MCGRYTLASADVILAELGAAGALPEWNAHYNLAPGQDLPVVVNRDGDGCARLLRWGFVPYWSKDLRSARKMINARRETLADKSMFRGALERRRCAVPADGFYEWRRAGKVRTPFYVHRRDGHPFAMAGLWERWKDPDGGVLESFAIITRPAVAPIDALHDRMPVILRPEHYGRWLDPLPVEPDRAAAVLAQPDDGSLEAFEVSTRVNSTDHDGSDLVAPSGKQPTLW